MYSIEPLLARREALYKYNAWRVQVFPGARADGVVKVKFTTALRIGFP
jgi:hypothetical protein